LIYLADSSYLTCGLCLSSWLASYSSDTLMSVGPKLSVDGSLMASGSRRSSTSTLERCAARKPQGMGSLSQIHGLHPEWCSTQRFGSAPSSSSSFPDSPADHQYVSGRIICWVANFRGVTKPSAGGNVSMDRVRMHIPTNKSFTQPGVCSCMTDPNKLPH